MIVYFSGTGNSQYCAKFLADRLQDECLDVFPFVRSRKAISLYSDKPWVFVAPTYAWQLPHIFQNLLDTGHFRGSSDAYFVMTCGSDIGNAAQQNREICKAKELVYHGTLPVVMPENYIALFKAPDTAKAQAIIEAAGPVLERGAAFIKSRRVLPLPPAGFIGRICSGAVNAAFYPLIVRAKPFRVTEACTHCGKCEAVCPLGNIRLTDGKPVWGSECTHCMACICKCPVSAIEYGRASVGKVRYQCPEYTESSSPL